MTNTYDEHATPTHTPLPGSEFETALKGAKPLYIVYGNSGEYASEHVEWPLLSFTDKERAIEYVDGANQWLRDRNLDSQKISGDDYMEALKEFPFDSFVADEDGSHIEGHLYYTLQVSLLVSEQLS